MPINKIIPGLIIALSALTAQAQLTESRVADSSRPAKIAQAELLGPVASMSTHGNSELSSRDGYQLINDESARCGPPPPPTPQPPPCAVPEPATYGVIGIITLLGVISVRQRRLRRPPTTEDTREG